MFLHPYVAPESNCLPVYIYNFVFNKVLIDVLFKMLIVTSEYAYINVMIKLDLA